MHKVVLAALTPVFAGTAFAQPTPAAPAGPDLVAPAPEDAATARYPQDAIDRPLTLPGGVVQVGLDVGTFTSAAMDPAAMRVLAGVGITDDLEINCGAYSFPTDDAGKGSLDANLGYKILRGAAGGKLEVIARAQAGYSLESEAANPLLLGVQVQYNVTPKIAIITPGQQLSIGLAGDTKPVALGLPLSLGVQVRRKLFAQLDTTLASVAIKDSTTSWLFADSTPIALTAFYTPAASIDVFAGVAMNLTPPDTVDAGTMMSSSTSVGDTLAILVGARYYLGKL